MRTRKTQTTTVKTATADSIEAALITLKSNAIVVVPEVVWVAVRAREAHQPTREGHARAKKAHTAFIHEGRFLLLRNAPGKEVVWCDTPQPYALTKRAWISHSLVAGYMNEFKLYCLLQLRDDERVLPAPKGVLTPHELGTLNQKLQQQAWETPTWERDRCFPPFPTPSPSADNS